MTLHENEPIYYCWRDPLLYHRSWEYAAAPPSGTVYVVWKNLRSGDGNLRSPGAAELHEPRLTSDQNGVEVSTPCGAVRLGGPSPMGATKEGRCVPSDRGFTFKPLHFPLTGLLNSQSTQYICIQPMSIVHNKTVVCKIISLGIGLRLQYSSKVG